jgi:hypothetical protein
MKNEGLPFTAQENCWGVLIFGVHIVTEERVSWLIKRCGFLDWTMQLLDTSRLQLLSLNSQWRYCQLTHLQSTFYSAIAVAHTLSIFLTVDSSLTTQSPLGLLSLTSPRVPASNRERYHSWISELSPLRSHSNTVHSLEFGPITNSAVFRPVTDSSELFPYCWRLVGQL